MIASLFRFIGDVGRLREIVTALFRAGLFTLFDRAGMGWCVGFWCRLHCWITRHQCHKINLPRELRLTFEKLGPSFMKLGQILSMQPDIVPDAFIQEFSKLQDQAPAIPFSVVRRIVEKELKGRLKMKFKNFSRDPIASASLGQVHEAWLLDGTKVAVKVQRPHVRAQLEKDIRIFRFILRRLERNLASVRLLRPRRALKVFEKSLWNELDYKVEGRNADRFRFNFRFDSGIKVPRIYWTHSTSLVLTMEFLVGFKMGNHKALSAKGVDHMKLMKNCVRGCLMPVFGYGFFHADPHPGNVWALADGRVGYLDFGMVGSISRVLRQNMLLFMLFVIKQDAESAMYYLLEMAEITKRSDIEGYSNEVMGMMISLFNNSEEQNDFNKIFYDIVKKGVAYRVYFSSALVMLAKAMVTGENMCRMTHPKMSYFDEARPILEEVYRKEFGMVAMAKEFQKLAPDLMRFAQGLPELLRLQMRNH